MSGYREAATAENDETDLGEALTNEPIEAQRDLLKTAAVFSAHARETAHADHDKAFALAREAVDIFVIVEEHWHNSEYATTPTPEGE